MDTVSPTHRSWMMSRVRSEGTKPEAALAMLFRQVVASHLPHRVRAVRNCRVMLGTPDIYVASLRLALFVDGCFFHGCPFHCKYPTTNADFWRSKIETNRRRDLKINRQLRSQGFSVWRFWEHELKPANLEAATLRMLIAIRRAVARLEQ